MRKPFLVLLLAGVLATACGEDTPARSESNGSPVRELPQPTTGPYVSVAVDNHFHDVHPEDDVEIAADRPLIFKNQGRNLHNVTISGTDINRDIRPGKEFRIDALGDFMEPGDYIVTCKYHALQGMTGEFRVVPAN
jgi:hypothetical protein